VVCAKTNQFSDEILLDKDEILLDKKERMVLSKKGEAAFGTTTRRLVIAVPN
jgi:hypothetical protein